MNRGIALLDGFLRARRLRRSEGAALIGVSRPLVTMWLAGTHKPGPENRRRIREATRGRVPIRSWDEPANQSVA